MGYQLCEERLVWGVGFSEMQWLKHKAFLSEKYVGYVTRQRRLIKSSSRQQCEAMQQPFSLSDTPLTEAVETSVTDIKAGRVTNQLVTFPRRPAPLETMTISLIANQSLSRDSNFHYHINKRSQSCKIWGFHGGDYEEWCLLGCYAVWLL
jgi:hypothetical protein